MFQRMSSFSSASDTTDEEQYVIGRLTEMGVRSQKIARSSTQKTCDLLADDDAASYVIEVKRRRSDEAIRKALRKKSATGLLSHPMGFSSSTENTMRHAVKQLDAIARDDEAFKLIWYYIEAQYNDEEMLIQQVYDTAFGGTNLIKMPTPGEASPIHCLFFHRSVFSTHP